MVDPEVDHKDKQRFLESNKRRQKEQTQEEEEKKKFREARRVRELEKMRMTSVAVQGRVSSIFHFRMYWISLSLGHLLVCFFSVEARGGEASGKAEKEGRK